MDIIHSVVHKIHLSVSFLLPQDGVSYQLLVEFHHVGLDGIPFIGRRFDERNISYTR